MYYLHYIYQQMLILLNLDEEEGKQVLEEVLKGSLSSSVGESTVWHNLNDKKRSTVSSMKPLMLDKIEDHSFEDRDVILQKVGSSYAQFRTPIHIVNETIDA